MMGSVEAGPFDASALEISVFRNLLQWRYISTGEQMSNLIWT